VTPPHAPLILIVDDYDDALDIYGSYLTFKGYRTVAATSGEEAVAAARAYRPNVILMDLRMAGMTGTDAMRTLRSDDDFSSVPIAALTAHALEDEMRQALADGFDAVIAKPCLPQELVDHVERLLASQRPSAS
jgi:two-component system, cell cycle response regulator DivK